MPGESWACDFLLCGFGFVVCVGRDYILVQTLSYLFTSRRIAFLTPLDPSESFFTILLSVCDLTPLALLPSVQFVNSSLRALQKQSLERHLLRPRPLADLR
ncbi:hypothetical protein B5807_09804 [Epicoccum nigrum]|uniref:Uncharacterized protein n=1 Tax=Epicoccum nigrum TaxID=105696 RepID=A0A1Y2LTK5_EPING|nr:hypothetical protein B5807_09804 [Epicoccum nigrum]